MLFTIVAGNWSMWENNTVCSHTCGGGVQDLIRRCNNPVPGANGKKCETENGGYALEEIKMNVTCNNHSCPGMYCNGVS